MNTVQRAIEKVFPKKYISKPENTLRLLYTQHGSIQQEEYSKIYYMSPEKKQDYLFEFIDKLKCDKTRMTDFSIISEDYLSKFIRNATSVQKFEEKARVANLQKTLKRWTGWKGGNNKTKKNKNGIKPLK